MNNSLKRILLIILIAINLILFASGFLYHPIKQIQLNVNSLLAIVIFQSGPKISSIDGISEYLRLNDSSTGSPYDAEIMETNARLKIFDLDSIPLKYDELDNYVMSNVKNKNNDLEIDLPFKEIYFQKSFQDTLIEPMLSGNEFDLERPFAIVFGRNPIKCRIIYNNPILIRNRDNSIWLTESNMAQQAYGLSRPTYFPKRPFNKSYRLIESNILYIICRYYSVTHGKNVIDNINRMLIVLEPFNGFGYGISSSIQSSRSWVKKLAPYKSNSDMGNLLISSNESGKFNEFSTQLYGAESLSVDIYGSFSDIEIEVEKGTLRMGSEDISLKGNDTLRIKGNLWIKEESRLNGLNGSSMAMIGTSTDIHLNGEQVIPHFWIDKPIEIKLLIIGILFSMTAWLVKTLVTTFIKKHRI